MKLAIMQPYFLPYLGYFALIKSIDRWIVFDDVQFIRHGWIERNRILKPNDGWQYICVPLEKHSRETHIKDIRIRNYEDWKDKIIRQLEHYKKIAPFYSEVINFLRVTLDHDFEWITKLNVHLLSEICRYIQIDFIFQIYSEMNLDISQINAPGDWAPKICEAVNASEYINPIGGFEIFNSDTFMEKNIKLSFLKINLKEYKQGKRTFESGLSIIDVMMFNSKEEISNMLNQYELI